MKITAKMKQKAQEQKENKEQSWHADVTNQETPDQEQPSGQEQG